MLVSGGGLNHASPSAPDADAFLRVGQAILNPAAAHGPSRIWRIVVVVVVCPLRLWWWSSSFRSVRLSAAEEDARENLEYYSAEDDESEQTCLPETRTVSLCSFLSRE